jgi:hypothetical protein
MVLNILAGLSLALCMASGVTWASRLLPRSWQIDFHFDPVATTREVWSISSRYNFVYIEHACKSDRRDAQNTYFDSHLAFSVDTTFLVVGKNVTMVRSYEIGFGYFPLVFAILPMVCWMPMVVRRVRAWLNPPGGICRRCGYDLRATPERCPECGTIPATVIEAKS